MAAMDGDLAVRARAVATADRAGSAGQVVLAGMAR